MARAKAADVGVVERDASGASGGPRAVPSEVQAVFNAAHAEDASPAARKELVDLRDRLAYVVVTGAIPTHLRPHFVQLLRAATSLAREPSAVDGRGGAVAVRPEVKALLKLEEHPLVVQARRYVAAGYLVAVSRGPNERRPYGRTWLYKPVGEDRAVRVTMSIDGSVREGFW